MGEDVQPPDGEHPLVGTVLADRYRVDKFLGAGGMGAVYLGEHVLMRKAVALKVLHREMTLHAEVVARFEREAVAAGRIDHPNVAAASDFGRLPDGSFYLVLEYVAGRSLADVIDEGPMGLERALAIAEQVASALVAAHDAGIVHRDLKPDNVMLVRSAEGGDLVKVLDFGIAKVVESDQAPGSGPASGSGRQLTRVGAVMGTVGYMAPEQALGQAVDHRADLYAFGVVLYEMVSGTRPYVAEELSQVIAKQLTDRPAPLPAGIPSELADLIELLLQNTPRNRPGNAVEVRDAIARLRAKPAQGAEPLEVRAVTTLDVPPSSAAGNAANDAPPAKGSGVAVFAVLFALLLGAGFAWRAASGSPAAASSADVASASAPGPSAAELGSAQAAPSSSAVEPTTRVAVSPGAKGGAPGVSSSSVTQVSETKTKTADGRTVTTRTKKHATTVVEKSEKRTTRRTGPGGIYIPPPSEWFK